MADKYPKTIKLKDGQSITLRLLTDNDLNDLHAFFQSLPVDDRMYLRGDVLDKEYIMRRFGDINYDLRFPVIAVCNDKIIGIGTLFRAEFGWIRNLGELRCVVSKTFQRKGLCTILVRELFMHALKTDLFKIQAEMMDNQKSAISAFQRMGFKEEAVLEKHVTDINGNRHNLVIMTLDIQDLWNIMEDFVPDSIYVT